MKTSSQFPTDLLMLTNMKLIQFQNFIYSYAFSTNGRKTIVSKSNSNENLGQRNGLSNIDVNQLKKYYKCGSVRPVKPPTPSKSSPREIQAFPPSFWSGNIS